MKVPASLIPPAATPILVATFSVAITALLIDYSTAWYLVGLNSWTKFGEWPIARFTWPNLLAKAVIFHGVIGANMFLRAATNRTNPIVGVSALLSVAVTLAAFWGSLFVGAIETW